MTGGGDKKQLGRILLQHKLVTQDELDRLLAKQKADPSHPRLASTAAQDDSISQVELLKALSEQHGLPGIDLSQVVVPLDNLKLIPAEIAKQHAIMPILVKEDRLFLAMADPSDKRIVDEIEFVTGRRIFPYVALHDALAALIDEAYRMAERGETHYVGPNVPLEYLQSIGLAPPAAAPPPPPSVSRGGKPPPPPPPTPKQAGVVQYQPGEDDELGIETAAHPAAPPPPLDPAFASRVAPLPTEEPRPRATTGKRSVLVVDDEDDIRRLLKRVLTERGYVVHEASKGLEALTMVRDHMPDMILLDAMLPEVHGFDICRRIKGSKRYGHIPIVMVSAVYRGWRVAEDLRASYGVDAFLEKPFKIGDVLAAVESALEGRSGAGPEADDLSGEAQAALERGIAAFKSGALDEAIEHLREGIAIDPLAFRLHFHIGLLYGRREETIFEAIQALETAVDLQPRHFAALKNLAVLFQRAGFRLKAMEMWERALGTSPDDDTRRQIKDILVNLL